MFIELITTFIVGLAAAGSFLLVNRTIGGRLPRFLLPLAAGAAMIGFAIYSEYTWHARTVGTLPDGFVVISQNESRVFFRPWTYWRPFVDRFAAVEPGAVMTNDAVPDQRIANVYLFGRWQQPARVPVLVDCAGSRRADLIDETDLDAATANWRDLPPTDPLLSALCPEA